MVRSSVIAISGLWALIVTVILVPPALSQGKPFADQTTQHDTILNAIADLQEAVDQLQPAPPTPPCGAGTAGQRFVVSPDSTEVCDNTTGLNWQKNPDSTQRTQADALAYCPTVRAGSRLPEVQELSSLVDYSQSNPTLPLGHPFSNIQFAGYWTATTFAVITAQAWRVHFDIGVVNANVKTTPEFVWCVRNGP